MMQAPGSTQIIRTLRTFRSISLVPSVQRIELIPDDDLSGPAGTASIAHFERRICDEVAASKAAGGHAASCLVVQVNGSDPDITGLEPVHAARLVGDLARFLVQSCRPEHVICNYAPGVFAVLLPGAARGSAIRTADRLLTLIRGRAWRIADCHVDLLCSVGVAHHRNDEDESAFLERALLAARRAGGTGQLVAMAA